MHTISEPRTLSNFSNLDLRNLQYDRRMHKRGLLHDLPIHGPGLLSSVLAPPISTVKHVIPVVTPPGVTKTIQATVRVPDQQSSVVAGASAAAPQPDPVQASEEPSLVAAETPSAGDPTSMANEVLTTNVAESEVLQVQSSLATITLSDGSVELTTAFMTTEISSYRVVSATLTGSAALNTGASAAAAFSRTDKAAYPTASSSSSTAGPGVSTVSAAKIGLGVGIPLALLLVGLVAAAIRAYRRRHRPQNPWFDYPPSPPDSFQMKYARDSVSIAELPTLAMPRFDETSWQVMESTEMVEPAEMDTVETAAELPAYESRQKW